MFHRVVPSAGRAIADDLSAESVARQQSSTHSATPSDGCDAISLIDGDGARRVRCEDREAQRRWGEDDARPAHDRSCSAATAATHSGAEAAQGGAWPTGLKRRSGVGVCCVLVWHGPVKGTRDREAQRRGEERRGRVGNTGRGEPGAREAATTTSAGNTAHEQRAHENEALKGCRNDGVTICWIDAAPRHTSVSIA